MSKVHFVSVSILYFSRFENIEGEITPSTTPPPRFRRPCNVSNLTFFVHQIYSQHGLRQILPVRSHVCNHSFVQGVPERCRVGVFEICMCWNVEVRHETVDVAHDAVPFFGDAEHADDWGGWLLGAWHVLHWGSC